MVDVVLAIASTTGVAVVLRLARKLGRNIEVVIAVNYVVAAMVGAALFISSGDSFDVPSNTLLFALGGGPLWPGAFHLYAWGIATFGIARSGAWARLSLAVPVLVGILFLGEAIDIRLVLGLGLLLLAFAALTPASTPSVDSVKRGTNSRNALFYAVALIVVFGIIDAWISLFEEFGGGEDLLFFVILFSTAAFVSWVALLARRTSIKRRDLQTGAILGVLNFGVSWFLLRALSGDFENRSAIVFTLFSACLLYTSPSPRDRTRSRMPSSA